METIIQAFARLNKITKQRLWRKIKTVCDRYPETLVKVPMAQGPKAPKEVWMSRGYLVQIFDVNAEWEVMAVSRNAFDGHFTRFLDGISWHKMQELKSECGRAGSEAIELYPADDDIQSVIHRYVWVRKKGSFMDEQQIGWKHSRGFKPAVLDLMTVINAASKLEGAVSPALISMCQS